MCQVVALEFVVIDSGLPLEHLRAEGVFGVRVRDRQDQLAPARDGSRGVEHVAPALRIEAAVDDEHGFATLHDADVGTRGVRLSGMIQMPSAIRQGKRASTMGNGG